MFEVSISPSHSKTWSPQQGYGSGGGVGQLPHTRPPPPLATTTPEKSAAEIVFHCPLFPGERRRRGKFDSSPFAPGAVLDGLASLDTGQCRKEILSLSLSLPPSLLPSLSPCVCLQLRGEYGGGCFSCLLRSLPEYAVPKRGK